MKNVLTAALVCLATAGLANDDQFDAPMRAYLDNYIRAWASDPSLVAAITAQNRKTMGYDQATIDAMDKQWRGEVGTPYQPLVDAVISNATADILRSRVKESGGAATEIFIMDARGLNVAASAPTSDYWQGDEDKHIQTYLLGANSVHFGDIEYDESTETVQGQISVTIVDSTTGQAVGAMTVGIDLMELM